MGLRQKIKTQTLVLLLVITYAGIGALYMLANHVILDAANGQAAEKTDQATDEATQIPDIVVPDDYEFVEPELESFEGYTLFPVNKNGLTYGYIVDLDGDGVRETVPELIVAIATNGTTGYVKVNELFPEKTTGDDGYRAPVYVYDVEGETIIGYLDEGSFAENETELRRSGGVLVVETLYGNEALIIDGH